CAGKPEGPSSNTASANGLHPTHERGRRFGISKCCLFDAV
ncbi:hypothetical protein CEXT_274511, partial [Caerostris extrusa]